MSDLDSDIYVDLHDEIMLWADRNLVEILKEIYPFCSDPEWRVGVPTWEKPITTTGKEKRLLGFTDLFVTIHGPSTGFHPNQEASTIIDVKTRIRPGPDIRQIRAYQEFLREDYDNGERASKLLLPIIISPDERYRELLAEQRIQFFRYDPSRWKS